jgi:tricorn protease
MTARSSTVYSLLASLLLLSFASALPAAPPVGYYRQPTLHGDTLVFVAEGDLWKVGVNGGVATRLTSHAGDETLPAISPDGKTIAFAARYEGPADVYTMPISGGAPTRHTFEGAKISSVGWTPDGKVVIGTDAYSTLPDTQLVLLDVKKNNARTVVPLSQAADGCYDGKTLFFTRLPFQGSHTRRYKGGTAQNLWKFGEGGDEARPLTADYPGTSKNPMAWQGRIYFLTDRDGTMNVWSMSPDGGDLKQHTRHSGWDVAGASLHDGRVAYQLGADIHVFDLAAGKDRIVSIALDSDFDQTRERWVKDPMDYLSSAHISPDGNRVALTARGRVFVAPHRQGRLVEATVQEGVRYRDARFMPDGKTLLAMSDQTGEVELWTLPANGVGAPRQLTRDGEVLRWEGIPSPDGRYVAHHDKNQQLFLYDVEKKENQKIDKSRLDSFESLRWSPDSKWLAYAAMAENQFRQVKLFSVAESRIIPLTTDRYDSYSPAWPPDGKWIYLLSDRNLKTLVPSPWGTYQPEPFLDKKTKIYQIPLRLNLRSPFAPVDELHPGGDTVRKEEVKPGEGKKPDGAVEVKIDTAGLRERLLEVPVAAGNYDDLSVNDKGLFFRSTPTGGGSSSLSGVLYTRDDVEVKTVVADVRRYEMSQDGKKLLVQKAGKLYVVDANPAATADLNKKDVDLSGWALSVVPREEWRQMFAEAWRLERDYFYDRGMHGVDWPAVRKKYEPLVDRVASRAELSDLVAQMVSELSALHIFVRGGDLRKGEDSIALASLGAVLVRDEPAGGYRVEHVYRHDPDEPDRAAPLSRPGVDVKAGDVIESINGTPVLSVPDANMLLRRKAGRQVLMRVKPKTGEARDVVVTPTTPEKAADLRYHEWEYTRRVAVDEMSKNEIGYVHLRAMGGDNFTEWARNFYPVFTRQGLVIDVRHNRGGNIDSWILARLLRKAWFHWTQRVGQQPSWNMQYAFRGHVVVLCNEYTASDGEAFTEGVRRLGIGKVIGTRTWGGEIWLTGSNSLVDRGVATSAEFGVYGPEGVWLIEGRGVEPDLVVDNLPHATFKGKDAQLEAAVKELQRMIKEKPVVVPPVPKHPDKSK